MGFLTHWTLPWHLKNGFWKNFWGNFYSITLCLRGVGTCYFLIGEPKIYCPWLVWSFYCKLLDSWFMARTYLQPHYGNGVFGNVLPFSWTTLRGKHCRHPIAVMGVVDTFGHGRKVQDFRWTSSFQGKMIYFYHGHKLEVPMGNGLHLPWASITLCTLLHIFWYASLITPNYS